MASLGSTRVGSLEIDGLQVSKPEQITSFVNTVSTEILTNINDIVVHKDGTQDNGNIHLSGNINLSGNYIQTTDTYTQAYGRNSFIQAETVVYDNGTPKYARSSSGTKGWVVISVDAINQRLKLSGDVTKLKSSDVLDKRKFSLALNRTSMVDFSKISAVSEDGWVSLINWSSDLDDLSSDTQADFEKYYKSDDNGFFDLEDSTFGIQVIENFYGQHAEGGSVRAVGKYTHAEGRRTIAGNRYAHAEGDGCEALGQASHAEGYNTKASNFYAHSEGNATTASGKASHAEGINTKAKGNYSHAEGSGTQAIGDYAHAEGTSSQATGLKAHAEGQSTIASNTASHAEGYDAEASGEYSHAEGWETSANGTASHAEGYQTSALTGYSHAEGQETLAYGQASHAEGYETSANFRAHAEGVSTIAHGTASHAEGSTTEAHGQNSHAEGGATKAIGQNSHAGGYQISVEGHAAFGHGQNINMLSADRAVAFGKNSTVTHVDSFIWNGTTANISSDAVGQFKIVPQNGINGFYIGENNFVSCVIQAIESAHTNSTLKTKLKNALTAILA